MTSICVLDGHTLNPGDLDWSVLAAFGDVEVHERTPAGHILARAAGKQVLLTNKTPLDADTLAALPELKYIGVLATGTNVVDMDAARRLGIAVTNVPGYGPDAVAQNAFAHVLHHISRVWEHHQAVIRGAWSAQPDFCFTLGRLESLSGMTLGLVGFGDIARHMAAIGAAFGMKLLVTSRKKPDDLPAGAEFVPLQTLFARADVLSLHCPLTAETAMMVNRENLALMKQGALIINTARGGLVDEAALADALHQGRIRAAVDVLSSEPPSPDNPLLHAPNISITPHNAWATVKARQNLLDIALANLDAFLRGEKQNRVD
ncbi:D-2-hydroxyacid dehydrogenase [Shewanella sp. JM162201]|uniref:D-2-hydroxyacid dehydrogenase n=1 Tax=Shewanella jiangmenensis TaxID=2837387 RepID=A0ABS5V3J2_9GAMM|nr:D-2-hydroxyacid dehydrogenase [Shewanella jiangmenensis]MBT1443623.1 D-2-hydroxyacid dehydrogenase [Shewanella jiangmenensis]